MEKFEKRKLFQGFSPFVILGVVLILVPIFVVMTMDNIREQNGRTIEKLTGKGIFLIRAFEAGTRTGMMVMGFGAARLQRLLTETALQPEVVYMMITTAQGKILAHSNPEKVGEIYGDMPDISALSDPAELLHREIGPEGEMSDHVFQVVKKFTPAHRRFRKGYPLPPWCRGKNRGELHYKVMFNGKFVQVPSGSEEPVHGNASVSKKGSMHGKGSKKEMSLDWFRAHFVCSDKKNQKSSQHHGNHIIFAALDMSEVKIIKEKYLRHAIAMGCMFFVLGCAGIVTLLAFQGYRSARTSLYRVKAFSDRVVENMPVGLITIDGDLQVTFCNDAALNILKGGAAVPESGTCKERKGGNDKGWGRGEREGDSAVKRELVLPLEMLAMAHELKLGNRKIVREISCGIYSCYEEDLQEDDQTLLLEIKGSPIWDDEQQQVAGYLFLFQDITELRELKSEIERSRRLASVGKLAAGVAHEIRNPLSSIKGFATYFRERYSNVDDDREVADVMIQEVERLNRAVSQLLELSRPLPVSAAKINIQDTLAHSIKLIEHDLNEKGIKVDVDVNLENREIVTDPDRLNQILLNLYLNAMQAMEENGLLGIKVRETDGGKMVLLEVSDTGRGIEQKDLEHIFDPYFTNRPGGTGLGLAMVHRAIEALDAEIRVESRQDRGTTFFIKIPAGTGL